MNITGFCKQRATYTPPAAQDEWGAPLPGAAVQIRCRIDKKERYLKDKDSVEYQNRTEYMTPHPIALGGRIDGHELLYVEEMVDIGGKTFGYLGYPHAPSQQ